MTVRMTARMSLGLPDPLQSKQPYFRLPLGHWPVYEIEPSTKHSRWTPSHTPAVDTGFSSRQGQLLPGRTAFPSLGPADLERAVGC